MDINLNNYEIYFIDFFDGNLTAKGESELMLFLASNPGLKKEFDDFENINLEKEEMVFSQKSSIKKTGIQAFASVNEETYENVFVAFYEDDLSNNEKMELEQFLGLNSFLKQEFEIHAKLQLPKQEIVFKNKSQLKKRQAIVSWRLSLVAAAAAIALLMSTFWVLNEKAGFENTKVVSINYAESKSIPFKNNASMLIAERKINPIVFETKAIVEPMPISEFEVQEKLIRGRNEIISFVRSKGDGIAPTGEIECAKLMTGSSNTDLLLAFANTGKNKKGILAKIVNNNTNKVMEAIKPNNLQYAKYKNDDPALVKVLQGGISVFNTITGSEVEQHKVYDGNGNLKSIKIETEMLTLNKTISPAG